MILSTLKNYALAAISAIAGVFFVLFKIKAAQNEQLEDENEELVKKAEITAAMATAEDEAERRTKEQIEQINKDEWYNEI